METLNGELRYVGWWNRPWNLVTDSEEKVDLWPYFEKLFTDLNGKGAEMDEELESLTISGNEKTDWVLIYEAKGDSFLLVLKKREGFGFSNIIAYLEDSLMRLNGRKIIVEIKNSRISLRADPAQKVFGLFFTDNNSCKIPEGKEQEICKIGRGIETCIFVSVTGKGFMCEKFNSPFARILLDRLAKKQINAGRIGNCALLGRKEK